MIFNGSEFTKSAEFHQERKTGIGGSDVAIIMGISPWRTPYQLWLEKTGRKEPEDISHKPHVIRGVLGEKTCRMLIEREYLKSFVPRSWKGEKEYYRCSDDGYSPDLNAFLEIKCMGKDNHEQAKQGVIPPYYMAQCQWNLYVSKAEKCLFVSFKPETEDMKVIEVLPDKKAIDDILSKVDDFWINHIVADVPPPMSKSDFVEITDMGFEAFAKKLDALELKKKELDESIDAIKESMKSFLGNHLGVEGFGYRIQRSFRRGEIDWKKVPVAEGVDPENYRKPISESISIRKVKNI